MLGAVQRSGNVEMTKHNLTLLEALGQVGGLSDQRANNTGVEPCPNGRPGDQPDGPWTVFGWTCSSRR